MEKGVKVCHIKWEAFGWSETDDNFSHTQLNREFDIGLYQIYGFHPVYGSDVLLYIGQTTESFGARFAGHAEWNETAISDFTRVHVGRLESTSDVSWENRHHVIDVAEKVLIRAHSPALNQNHAIRMLREYDDDPWLFLNWGQRGQLAAEASTMRASFRYWSGVGANAKDKNVVPDKPIAP